MVEAITADKGVVDKFIGDAVMAVFGGVLDLENPCDSALSAALSMKKALATLNASWEGINDTKFRNGIGIHYGEVLQGTIGSSERKDFTVIGDTVNTASRIEGLTKNYTYSILVTAAFYAKLSEANKNRCVALESVKVKGKEESIMIYGVKRS